MSSFHEIGVTLRATMRPKNMAALVNSVGGLHRTGMMAATYKACEKLSKHPAVEHVTLTLVQESNAGIWRNGKRTK